MSEDQVSARQFIENARLAYKRGDHHAARHWAQRAVALSPGEEDGWLLMAAVASPEGSVAYLREALRVNPSSQRARQGMYWARKRLAEGAHSPKPVAVPARIPSLEIKEPLPEPKKNLPSLKNLALLLLVFILITGFISWPSIGKIPIQAGANLSGNGIALALPETGEKASQYLSLAGVVKPTYTPTPTPSPTATPLPTATPTPLPLPSKLILVDISDQYLYAYEDDMLVYSFVASTGMGNSTRVGTFSILDKIPNAYGSLWDIWMPDWMGIYYSGSLENGIHSLPILPGGNLLWEGFLGTPISYGCIVLGVQESRLLYDWAEIGTPVIIQW